MDREDELPTMRPLPTSSPDASGAGGPPPDDSRTINAPPPVGAFAEAPTLREPPSGSGFESDPPLPPTGAGGSDPGSRPRSRLRGSSRLVSSAGSGGRSGLHPGAVFAGRYEVLDEIARGGMGVVYRARHVHLGTVVALKVMLAGNYATDEDCRRFILEAEASARLKHPHIVPVHDIGEEDGQLYFTMDFVEGAPLSKRKTQLERPRLLDVMIKATGAVAYAHQRGIIHRDLKPANIMMTAADEPMIMDFGLAKQVALTDEEGKPSLQTREGAIMGTPHYMPPEQAEGLVSEVDVRSDVYALGVILYEVFTGRLPFEGRTVSELLMKIFEQDPAPPRAVDPTIDPDLEAIILKAIEKEKARRYESAAELQRDLERLRDGLPVQARRAGVTYRLKKWLRRRRGAVAAGAALTLVLTASTSALIYQRNEAELTTRRDKEAQRAKSEQALRELGLALPALTRRLGDAVGAGNETALSALEADVASLVSESARHVARLEDDDLAGVLRADLQLLASRLAVVEGDAERALEAHSLLARAEEALRRVEALRKEVSDELTRQAQADVEDESPTELAVALERWASLPAALPRTVASDDPAFARIGPALDEASRHVFAALNAAPERSPTRARAAALVEQIAAWRRELDEAARAAERTRLALRLRNAAGALLALLDRRDLSTPDERSRLLRGARLSQALVQRAIELTPDSASDEAVAGLKSASARVYAEVLLALNAYEVFDAEVEGLDAKDRADLEAQRREKKAAEEARREEIDRAKQVEGCTRAQLEERLTKLERLADVGLPSALEQGRREALADVRAALVRLDRDEVYRAIDAAAAGARDPGVLADTALAEQADAQHAQAAALLERRVGAFADDPRALAEQRARCAGARFDLLLGAARAARARGELGPAETFARRAVEALPASGPRADDVQAASALLEELRRERGTPEGMVLLPGGDLGSGRQVRPFYLSRREVTWAEWAAVMRVEAPPGREDLPVTDVTFEEAQRFASAVGRRLPTDDEWELAARLHAGRLTEFPWGDRFEDGQLSDTVRAPGSNRADVTPEGIFDLGGNVSEWVIVPPADGGRAAVPAIRGASFLYPLRRVARGAHRMQPRGSDYAGPQLGLRLAKDASR